MRLIIAGGRGRYISGALISSTLAELGWQPTVLVCGMARGVDMCAWRWAKVLRIPIEEHPADWEKHGTRAGPLRNEEMAKVADALLAFPSIKSPGTRDMIRRAQNHGLLVKVRA